MSMDVTQQVRAFRGSAHSIARDQERSDMTSLARTQPDQGRSRGNLTPRFSTASDLEAR
jgi:hypothetical protein